MSSTTYVDYSAATPIVAAWLNDVDKLTYGVVRYGATPSTFQSAINATTDGTIAVIIVPEGTYTGDFSTLTTGTRTMVWMERGAVTYSIAPPPGNRMFSTYTGDTTRPWLVGQWGVVNNGTSGGSTDRPTLRVQRDASHTGGTTGGSVNASALSVQNTVGTNVQNYENAIVAQLTSNTAQTVQTPNLTVFQGTLFKEIASTGGFFGANFVARDETKLGSTNSKGGLVGTEIDVVASGPDSVSRIILDLVGRGYDASVDGASSIYAGLRVRPANSGVLSSEAMTLLNGIVVDPGSLGAITTGISVTGKTGASHIEVLSDNTIQGIFKIGSQRQTATNTTAQIVMTGWNSSNAKVNYGAIVTTISSPTAASESGTVAFQSMRAGTLTTEVTLAGGVMVGVATGGNKGVGTINLAADIYKNNTAYNNPDYVFEKYYTGQIVKFADKEGAVKYSSVLPLDQLRDYTKIHLRLPGMTDETMGVFERTDKALEKIEELSLYIMELHERIKTLESRL